MHHQASSNETFSNQFAPPPNEFIMSPASSSATCAHFATSTTWSSSIPPRISVTQAAPNFKHIIHDLYLWVGCLHPQYTKL